MNEFDFSAEAFLSNPDSEKVVLGSILLEPELLKDCYLAPEQFGVPKHQVMFEVFKSMEEKGIPLDIVSVPEVAGSNRMFLMGGLASLMELATSVFTTTNFSYHQENVSDYYKKRKGYEIGRYLMQNAPNMTSEEMANYTAEAFDKLEDGGGETEEQESSLAENIAARTFENMQKNNGKIAGATTGYRDLDKILSGMRKQDLIIVGARPSVGKTAFAVNVGINFATSEPTALQPKGGVVALFSLEMSDESLMLRMFSNMGNIDAQRIRNPMEDFLSDDWNRTVNAITQLSGKAFHIFDKPGADMVYIRKTLRWIRKKYQGQHVVVVIDYLQLIAGDTRKKENRQQEVSDISKGLKTLARELDMTIVALSQLSRKVEDRADKRPMLSDLRESGSIEQDADVIALLYREDYYDKETDNQNIIEIDIAKQRNGPTGTVSLAFVKENSKFVNIAQK